MESWVQIIISLGTFTVINLSATAFLVGKIVQTVKDHGEQIDESREVAGKLKERLSPISSDDRLISAKDCIDGKAMVTAALNDIKTMLKNAAQRQGIAICKNSEADCLRQVAADLDVDPGAVFRDLRRVDHDSAGFCRIACAVNF